MIALTLLTQNISFATSGACSYHSGVNCSAGASYTGKVQCNDGWINSSVYFSEAEECKVKFTCEYPRQAPCDVESAKLQAQQLAQKHFDSANARWGWNGYGLVNKPVLEDYTQDYNYIFCKDYQAIYEAQLNTYNGCRADESKKYQEEAKIMDAKIYLACIGAGYSYSQKDGCIDPFKIITDSLPDAIVNKQYSTEIKFTQDAKVKEIPVLNLSSLPESFYSASMNSNGYYGVFTMRLTPRKLGKFTFSADVSINGTPVTSKTFSLNVVDENKTEISTTTTKTTLATTTQKFFSSFPSSNDLIGEVSFTRTLRKGMSGNDIKQLQTILQRLNYLPITQVPSTYFGNVTNNAVIKFQKDNKIQPATGLFGPTTQKIFIQKIKGVTTQ